MAADMSRVLPIADVAGEDDEETAQLRELHERARAYLQSHPWCRGIEQEFFGGGIGGVVAVFLFRITPKPPADEWLWVVTGDLPSAYLVTDDLPDAPAVLETYCDLMSDWVDAVRQKGDLRTVYPVDAKPTREHADMLASRIEQLRETIIPAIAANLDEREA